MAPENLLSVREAAAYLGITVSTLYGWTCHRLITFVKVGRLVKFRLADLEAYVERRSVQARKNYSPKRFRTGGTNSLGSLSGRYEINLPINSPTYASYLLQIPPITEEHFEYNGDQLVARCATIPTILGFQREDH
jgi:excisionase family DNA binding protein